MFGRDAHKALPFFENIDVVGSADGDGGALGRVFFDDGLPSFQGQRVAQSVSAEGVA